MTNETKKLFNAPWRVEVTEYDETIFSVINDDGCYIAAQVTSREDANSLARLPELYDALAEATKHYCGICHNLSGQDEPKIEDLIKNGCPKAQDKNRAHVVSCVALDWLKLLRKVRDGK